MSFGRSWYLILAKRSATVTWLGITFLSRLNDIVGGGPFGLKAGQWTDDTAMAVALADSLTLNDGLDEADLMGRFVRWYEQGEYSCTGSCFDIGVTTRQALSRWKRTGN